MRFSLLLTSLITLLVLPPLSAQEMERPAAQDGRERARSAGHRWVGEFTVQGATLTRKGEVRATAEMAREAFRALPPHRRQGLLFFRVETVDERPIAPRPAPGAPRTGFTWVATHEEQGVVLERRGAFYPDAASARRAYSELAPSARRGLSDLRIEEVTRPPAPREVETPAARWNWTATFVDQQYRFTRSGSGYATKAEAQAAFRRERTATLGSLERIRYEGPETR